MNERHVVRLPLRLRNVVADGGPVIAPMVHCPRQGKSIDALRCTGCARMTTMQWDPAEGGEIVCAAGEDLARPADNDRRTDLAEAAARRQLHEMVEPVTMCVHADAPLKDVRRLIIEHRLRAVPVVDEEYKLVGIVSRSDLVGAPDDGVVRDVMPARTHALPEHAPLGYAIALMAFEHVSEVPVVTDSGELVGLWHALDALEWIAKRMGYVPPERNGSGR